MKDEYHTNEIINEQLALLNKSLIRQVKYKRKKEVIEQNFRNWLPTKILFKLFIKLT